MLSFLFLVFNYLTSDLLMVYKISLVVPEKLINLFLFLQSQEDQDHFLKDFMKLK